MSIILSLVGSRISDDVLTRQGYRQVVRISGKDLVSIFGTRTTISLLRLIHMLAERNEA